MGFDNIEIGNSYRSDDIENIGTDFILKVLNLSVTYDRSVGFFSSSSLIYTSRGLLSVAQHYQNDNKPVIRFITSPRLSLEDVNAIKSGYENRQTIIENALLRDFQDPEDDEAKERLNILSHLISSGAMDIKIAVSMSDNEIGMYHEKIGIMRDENGKAIAFTGSLNESENSFLNNFESIQVYKNWTNSKDYFLIIENDFEKLWNNCTNKVEIFNFPVALRDKIFEYHRESYNENIDQEFNSRLNRDVPSISTKYIPSTFPYDFQKEAINTWFSMRCRGIFSMATGTGKTMTAYAAIISLLERTSYHLATVIVCPYQHLVEQWAEEAQKFNINNLIIGYSNGEYKDYKDKLYTAIQSFNQNKKKNYFFFITTNASYKKDYVQNQLKQIQGPALFVADEAHNLGSKNFKNKLLEIFQYRLALSATIERYRDDDGTKQLFDYFGTKCIDYPLERAIQEKKLTKYEYYPIVVYLDSDEREQYIELIMKMSKLIHGDNEELSEPAKRLAIMRAKIIANASNKVAKLKDVISDYKDEHYILVYCGISKIEDKDVDLRQITQVTQMLGNELGMKVATYTSKETIEERKDCVTRFKDGNDLQALVAIKCLDEGVNIPNIRTAFILASSTNPREYVQRRGRVLRLADGKDKAIIYDFITLPVTFSELNNYSLDETKIYKSLVNNEINRMIEFGKHATNSSVSEVLTEKIKEQYGLYAFDPSEYENLNNIDTNE